ncbi:MAG: phenylalanine 4-monooxygenase [Chitinophagales bacterium]|nr:phenylalanine 4-monooxygenase [Chitinophagales bacterium]
MNQEYEKYTPEDHKVWSLLYEEQMRQLPNMATRAFMDGIKKVGFKSHEVPRFTEVNEALKNLTGWTVYVVPGYVDNFPFFSHLGRKEFPVTTWLREMTKFDYIVEPDMFHDVFGHVPLLSEQFFCDFLEGMSAIGLKHIDNPSALELISRIYWYTVEFGLIKEDGNLRIYGAGILSSPGESRYCLSDEAASIRFPYDVDAILESYYIKEKFQEKYFVLESYQQLAESIPDIDKKIQEYVDNDIYVEPNAVFTERINRVLA